MARALFDMDGTLFWGDSQLRFARWVLKRHAWRRLYLLPVLPCGILRACCIMNTQQMKRAFLAYAWGMTAENLQQECQLFCEQEIIPALYPEVLERLRQHQAAGDQCVLCSASPDWWTQEVGKVLGFDLTIGTPIEPSERVPFMPAVPAPGNNKGSNKLIRLAQHGITHADIGYTDSAADLPMLSICDKAVLINPKDSLIKQCEGAEVLRPSCPSHQLGFIIAAALGLGS